MKRYGWPGFRWIIVWVSLLSVTVSAAVYSGKVFCPNNNPSGGVDVKLYRVSWDMAARTISMELMGQALTDPQGAYRITSDMTITDGTQMISGIAKRDDYAYMWAMEMAQQDATFEFHMSYPQSLSGRVVDEQGKPVADAGVRLVALTIADAKSQAEYQKMFVNFDPSPFFTTTTDADGKFEFKELPTDCSAEFLITKPGMGQILTAKNDLNPGQGFQYKVGQKDISFTMSKGLTISGVVLDSKNKPLADISVVAGRENLEMDPTRKPVKTDADGQFTIRDVAPGNYQIGAVSDTLLFEPLKIDLKSNVGVQLKAKQGSKVRITVLDPETEKGREGVQVYLFKQNQPAIGGKTNAEGIFEKSVIAGSYTVQVQDGVRNKNQPVEVEDGKTAEVSVTLGGSAKLKVTATDPDGKPLAGVELVIMPDQGNMTNRAITKEDGQATIHWDPEQVTWVNGAFLLVGVQRDKKLAAVMDIASDTKDAALQLKPGLTVAGRVVDPNDKPIPKAVVSLQLGTSNWYSQFERKSYTTDSNGFYQIESMPAEGKYYLSIIGPKGFGSMSMQPDMNSAENMKLTVPDTVLKIANMSISGVVVDVEGKPLDGAQLSCYGDGQPSINVRTDKTGKFTMSPLCEGRVSVQASYQKSNQYMYANLTVESGATDVEIVISPENTSGRTVAKKPASLVGKNLPAAALSDPNQYAGKPVLVCVWDYQQRPSRYAVNKLAKQKDMLAGKGIAVILLQGETMDKAVLEGWLKENKIDFRFEMVASDAEKVRFGLGVQGLPWMILADKEHKVLAEGFDVGSLDAAIEKIK